MSGVVFNIYSILDRGVIAYVVKYILTFEKYFHLQGLKVLTNIEVCSETQTIYNKDFVYTFILLNIYILYSWNGSLLYTENTLYWDWDPKERC